MARWLRELRSRWPVRGPKPSIRPFGASASGPRSFGLAALAQIGVLPICRISPGPPFLSWIRLLPHQRRLRATSGPMAPRAALALARPWAKTLATTLRCFGVLPAVLRTRWARAHGGRLRRESLAGALGVANRGAAVASEGQNAALAGDFRNLSEILRESLKCPRGRGGNLAPQQRGLAGPVFPAERDPAGAPVKER